MAIAYDNSVSAFNDSSGTSLTTAAFTVGSLANRVIIVSYTCDTVTDQTPTCSYSGTSDSITRIAANLSNANAGPTYLFIIVNPQSGSFTITVSQTNSLGHRHINAASYSGVKQSSTVDAQNNNTQDTTASFSPSVTVATANSWVVSGTGLGNLILISAGAGTTIRQQANSQLCCIADSNGALGVGSQSLNFTCSGNNSWNSVTISLAPAPLDLTLSVSDAVAVSESIKLDFLRELSVSDSVAVSESKTISNSTLGNISISDTVSVAESVLLEFILFVNIIDSVAVSESITVSTPTLGGISISEPVSVSESITASNPNLGGISTTDSVLVSEDKSLHLISFISTSDSVAINESASSSITLGNINVSDSVTISESKTIFIVAVPSGHAFMRSFQQSYPFAMDETTPKPMNSKQQSYPLPMDEVSVL